MFRLFSVHPISRYNELSSICNQSRTFSQDTNIVQPFSAIPGPKPFPFGIGNIREAKQLLKSEAGENHPFTRLTREYGDIYKLYFGKDPMIVVNDADGFQTVLKNEGKLPVRSKRMELNTKWIHENNNMPVGMVFAHKNEWKRLRSAMTKQVTPRRVTHFTQPLCTVADSLCEHIKNTRDANGWMEDMWRPMLNWAMSGIVKVIFDEDLDTFSKDVQTEEFVETALAYVGSLGVIGRALPIYKVFPTKPYNDYVNSYSRLRQLGRQFLTNRYDKIRQDIEVGIVDENVAVGLLYQWLIEGKLTEEEALVQACDMLGAGIDTTSNTATYLLHELAKNTDIQDAVYKEVLEVVGPDKTPTTEQLQKLNLVRKCVKETLRLHPLLPFLIREIQNDAVILGYNIPAGTTCLFNFFLLGMDPKHFKEPTKFDPERWNHDSKSEAHPFASLPFGFGPRMCYGRRIAELELYVLLTRIVQKFKLSTDQMTIKQSVVTVLHPEEPVRIKFDNIR